jgi:S-adenosylmethionine decarboxylase
MTDDSDVRLSHGRHVYLDYINFNPEVEDMGTWILSLLRTSVKECEVKEVHAHCEVFDGVESPPGFAAIVLIDESHITAHCYSERGWLAIDAFTCGTHDPNDLADVIHTKLVAGCENLKLMNRNVVKRFLHDDISQNKE